MYIPASKDVRIGIRCDDRARQPLDHAAAADVVRANESITLTALDFQAFLAAVDAPAERNDALARAFDRHAKQVLG